MENQNNLLSTIILPTCIEALKDPDNVDYCQEKNITYRLLTWHGVGGANPEIQFWAPAEVLVQLLKDCYQTGDKIEDEYNLSLIKPA